MSDPMTAPASFRSQVLRECLESFPEVVFTVTGHCMRPDLVPGERVLVVGRGQKSPRFGDVVLTGRGDDIRLHRLVWRSPVAGSGGAFWTKADRGAFLDPSLAEEDVMGTVAFVEGRRYGRRPWRAFRSLLEALSVRVISAAKTTRTRP